MHTDRFGVQALGCGERSLAPELQTYPCASVFIGGSLMLGSQFWILDSGFWIPTGVIVDELHQGPDVIDGCCGEDSMAQIEHVSGLPSRAIQNLSGSLSNDGPGRHQGHRIEISLDTDVSSDAVPGVIQIRPPVHADDIPARLPHPRKKISRAGSEMD